MLGDVYTKRRLTSSAIESYRKAVEVNPGYFGARIPLVELLYNKKRWRDARVEAEAMIYANPRHSVPHYWLAKVCEA